MLFTGYDFHKSDFGSLAYHRIVESFKFAFGQKLRLGDPAFNDTIAEVRKIICRIDLLEGRFRYYTQCIKV